MIGDDHNAGHASGRGRLFARLRATPLQDGVTRAVAGVFLLLLTLCASAQETATAKGGIRGTIYDADFNVPVPAVRVSVPEANRTTNTVEDGHYAIADLVPGIYTVMFAKEGFQRETRINVLVSPGAFAEVDTRLFGEYTDMDELVVSDIDLGGASEVGLINLRAASVSMMDSVGADLMSRAGAGTAIAAMRLVTGASVQDGKYVVIRGLGDRYTSTLLNGVRLPTADKEKRAVQLDQFPAAIIESIQVNKTFMPDMQGDASGGGVNIVTKSLPDKRVLSASVSIEYDTQATGNSNFRTPAGGRNAFGGTRNEKNLTFWNPGSLDAPRGLWTEKQSATLREDAPPPNSGFKFASGDSLTLGDWQFGGLINGSYGQKYKYREGIKNKVRPSQVAGENAEYYELDPNNIKTTQTSTDEQLWSSGLTLGMKSENHEVKLTGIYTHLARLKTDLRYEYPIEPTLVNTNARRRTITTSRARMFDTLTEYAENANGTVQLAGKHTLEQLNDLELDWTAAYNVSESTEPDRQSFWGGYNFQGKTDLAGNPISHYSEAGGDFTRRWQDTREMSQQLQGNAKQPFTLLEQEGYVKVGCFADWCNRSYRNRVYSTTIYYSAEDEYDFSQFGSAVDAYPWSLASATTQSTEYDGAQEIQATYGMLRAPLPEWIDLIGGARMERTFMQTDVWSAAPDMQGTIDVDRVILGPDGVYRLIPNFKLSEEAAAASIEQVDMLPAVGINYKVVPDVSIRLAWSRTIARPTFRELTPVRYAEPDPSKFFVGNQDLAISALENYDLRAEFRPGGGMDLVAASVFYKSIIDPIQYTTYSDPGAGNSSQYLFPENYGDAWLQGLELEARKGLGFIWSALQDVSLSANVTVQDSFVQYTDSLKTKLARVGVADDGRIMDGQPACLYNVNLIYDNQASGISAGIFYNFKGETYVSGEGAIDATYIPNTLEMPLGSLDLTFGLKFAQNWRLGIEVKNLLNPMIETMYRGPMGDLPNYSYRQGRTYSISLGCTF